jgi:hypothetical protein
MYLHALNLSCVLQHYHIYERQRSSETMIPGHVLAIKESYVTLHVVLLSIVIHKNHKILITNSFLFYKLASCVCLTNNMVCWGHKTVVLLLQVV